MVRGFLALFAGSAIIIVPDMARMILLLPLALVMSILGLAVYGVLDGVLVLLLSYMAGSRPALVALRLQGLISMVVGTLLYLTFFDSVQLRWFLVLIAIQSLCTSLAEFYVARSAMTRALVHWNFAAAGVALAFGIAYLWIVFAFAAKMSPVEISWLVYTYLLAFGTAQCLTAARMLYADRRLNLVALHSFVSQEPMKSRL